MVTWVLRPMPAYYWRTWMPKPKTISEPTDEELARLEEDRALERQIVERGGMP